MITNKAIELALKTWYPVDHPLHDKAHHPLGKLLGEWGELLDDYMKLVYKPGFEPNFVDELGDIWYYIRILCYQRRYKLLTQYHGLIAMYNLADRDTDYLIAFAIRSVSENLLTLLNDEFYSLICLDTSYAILLELLDRRHITLNELTESNWQKLKPGSERGEEWARARDNGA